MKIQVEQVVNNIVYFTTKYGRGRAIWKESDKLEEKEYFAEFDIDTVYKYDDINLSSTKEYQIKIYNDQNLLTMLFIEYDESGCATFRWGESIVEIETVYDERFMTLLNLYVTIIVETLNIYNENP